MAAPVGDVCVGRARELDVLERALAAARTRTGAVASIAGEAGIGKTRLAMELGRNAGDDGFDVLFGRSIDLIGTELPYQPFVEALRPLGALPRTAQSRLQVFETALALLTGRAATVPVLLVLDDLHWADTSTLDLLVFLAHHLAGHRVLMLVTYRADEISSAQRMRRLADALGRAGATVALDLGPLEREDVAALLAARADGLLPKALTDTIVTRSEGNPFYAEELLAAAREGDRELPPRLRHLLLQRVSRLDRPAQSLLRVAAAAGCDVSYALLRGVADRPTAELRAGLRSAVEHGVLVADRTTDRFRFRHALLAEAIYATILPGEREELHARLAGELARIGAPAAELAPHWAAAGRSAEAVATSVDAARQAEAVFGLAEAHAHLERALAVWPAVPNAVDLLGMDLPALCSRAAAVAAETGAAPRAVELERRAIELVGDGDVMRAAALHERLARYLQLTGEPEAALESLRRAVELVPRLPPSAARAQALAALGHGLALAWRYAESCRTCLQALALARAVGARQAEHQALTDFGVDLAYVGRSDQGLAQLALARQLAHDSADPGALQRVYVALSDVLMMLGRPRESAGVAADGLDALGRFGRDQSTLVANHVEALVACGEWDDAERVSAAAVRGVTANHTHQPLITRAELEMGRGRFDAARAHLGAARPTVRGAPATATYLTFVAELALWECRWADADQAVDEGLALTCSQEMAQIRVWLCAKGLRAQAELTALARLDHDNDAARHHLVRASDRLARAHRAAADAAYITPLADGWLRLAEAEHARGRGTASATTWASAAHLWERLARPLLVAYCRWREAETLVSAGAPRAEATVPLRQAYALAARADASPLMREIDLVAQRARLDPREPEAVPTDADELPGLTHREAEVLALVARGLTNREIAGELVISTKTASVHVSHILRKLDAPNRRHAAALWSLAHRRGG